MIETSAVRLAHTKNSTQITLAINKKVNLCSRSSPYSINCHAGDMLVFRMLCRITQILYLSHFIDAFEVDDLMQGFSQTNNV